MREPASPTRVAEGTREGWAYAVCERLARTHYENFPVASRLLPPTLRPHIAAVYAFARIADDIADEPGLTTPQRLQQLDDWERELRSGASTNPIFIALHDSIRRFDLPLDLFTDLLSAFRQDVTTTRYETWDEVIDYCRRSANPVGRLVLRLAGVRDRETDRASDALCSALQLTNFWQDLVVDWRRGRLYLPREEYARAGAVLDDLDRGELTPAWRAALAASASRTSTLFDEGRTVCDAVGGRLRYELRATWLGGHRILDRLSATGFDVVAHRPTLGVRDAVMIGWRTLFWPRSR